MLPFFGPRTLRGGVGIPVDSMATLPYALNEYNEVWAYYGMELVDTRARLLQAEELISGDKYIFTRNAYLQRREYFLSGEVQDSFSDYEEDDFEEF
jgi:phospholipid-binding lipoprotein MlaA